MRTVSHYVQTSAYGERADAITKQFRDLRTLLPKSGNNVDPIPCSDPYAAYLHNGLGTKVLPFHHLFALIACYKRDGVPASLLLSVIHQFETEVEVMLVDEHERERAFPGPELVRLESARETKLEGKVNPLQEKVAVDPTDAHALAQMLREGPKFVAQWDRYLKTVRTQYAVVRGDQPRRVFGAGIQPSSPSLTVVRS